MSGLVVAPGFIDLHSHAQTLPGRRLQACDGVTTALELEAGRAPVDRAYAREAQRGSPIHFGFSASWAAGPHARDRGRRARRRRGRGLRRDRRVRNGSKPRVAAAGADPRSDRDRCRGRRDRDRRPRRLHAGRRSGRVSRRRAVRFVGRRSDLHALRDIVELAPQTLVDGAEELVRAAGDTGAHMHYCHINSSSARHIDRVLALVARCQSEGSHVTTEAYPYGSGSTAIGAAFLAPERLRERFRGPTRSPTSRPENALPTTRACASSARPTPEDWSSPSSSTRQTRHDVALLRHALTFPDAVVASDAMPPIWTGNHAPRPRRVAPAARGRHPPSDGGHLLTCASPLA